MDNITYNQIFDNIFKLATLEILNNNKKEDIKKFVKTTVNGDEIKSYLAIKAYLKPKKNLGIILYVLTNVRLIKIEISEIENINSSSFFLGSITSVERKIIDKDTVSIDIIFQNTSLGLRYPINNNTITNFFQKIEQLKTEGV